MNLKSILSEILQIAFKPLRGKPYNEETLQLVKQEVTRMATQPGHLTNLEVYAGKANNSYTWYCEAPSPGVFYLRGRAKPGMEKNDAAYLNSADPKIILNLLEVYKASKSVLEAQEASQHTPGTSESLKALRMAVQALEGYKGQNDGILKNNRPASPPVIKKPSPPRTIEQSSEEYDENA